MRTGGKNSFTVPEEGQYVLWRLSATRSASWSTARTLGWPAPATPAPAAIPGSKGQLELAGGAGVTARPTGAHMIVRWLPAEKRCTKAPTRDGHRVQTAGARTAPGGTGSPVRAACGWTNEMICRPRRARWVADQAAGACPGLDRERLRGARRAASQPASTSYTQGLNTNHCPAALPGAAGRGGALPPRPSARMVMRHPPGPPPHPRPRPRWRARREAGPRRARRRCRRGGTGGASRWPARRRRA